MYKAKYILTLLSSLLFLLPSIANDQVDSLEALLRDDLSVKDRIELNFQLINALNIKGAKADSIINESIILARKNNLNYEEAYGRYYRSLFFNKQQIFDESVLTDYLFADSFAQSNTQYKELRVNAGKRVAMHYFYNRDFKKASSKMQSTLDFALENQMEEFYSPLTINLGLFQGLDQQFFKAIENFQKALEYPKTRRANVYWNLADLYSRLEDWDQVIYFADLSIEIAKKEGFSFTESMSTVLKSNALFEKKEYEEAETILQKHIPGLKEEGNPQRLYGPYAQLIEIYLATDQLKKAKELEYQIPKSPSKTSFAPLSIVFGKVDLQLENYANAITNCETGKRLAIKNMPGAAPWVTDACDCLNKAYTVQKKYNKAHENLSLYQEAKEVLNERESVMNLSRALNQQELSQQKELLALEQEKEKISYQATLSKYKLLGVISFFIILAALWIANLFRKRNQKIGQQNQIISDALDEKDILLREIHHRVKNNLQLVSSLLGLQSRHIQDPGALDALNSGKARVKSMALIHQDLYNKENLTGVSVKEYFQKLSTELIASYRVDTDRIELHTEIPEMLLDVDTLIPIGLILNELLTNSLKYAFPDDRSGRVEIKVFEDANGLRLHFSDNGIGMDLSKKSDSSFGYKLIDTLLEQLEGEMHHEVDNGTQLYFTFTEYKIAA